MKQVQPEKEEYPSYKKHLSTIEKEIEKLRAENKVLKERLSNNSSFDFNEYFNTTIKKIKKFHSI